MYKLRRCSHVSDHSYDTHIYVGWSQLTEHLGRRSSWRHSLSIGSSWLNTDQKHHVPRRLSLFSKGWRLSDLPKLFVFTEQNCFAFFSSVRFFFRKKEWIHCLQVARKILQKYEVNCLFFNCPLCTALISE